MEETPTGLASRKTVTAQKVAKRRFGELRRLAATNLIRG